MGPWHYVSHAENSAAAESTEVICAGDAKIDGLMVPAQASEVHGPVMVTIAQIGAIILSRWQTAESVDSPSDALVLQKMAAEHFVSIRSCLPMYIQFRDRIAPKMTCERSDNFHNSTQIL